jgi:hypothetical protein
MTIQRAEPHIVARFVARNSYKLSAPGKPDIA